MQQQPDGKIQLPLPFRNREPTFTNNRAKAYNRTKNTLNSMQKKHPAMFQSSLKKFATNLDPKNPQNSYYIQVSRVLMLRKRFDTSLLFILTGSCQMLATLSTFVITHLCVLRVKHALLLHQSHAFGVNITFGGANIMCFLSRPLVITTS